MLASYEAWRRSPGPALRYLLTDPELDNFTYPISNGDELAAFLAEVLRADPSVLASYIWELQGDRGLRQEIEERLAPRADRRPTMPYGRRLGWYAIARQVKPRLVVETGIHDGLGSSILLRALERNAADGVEGSLVSFDIRPDAGWLIPMALRRRHDVRIGNSLTMLSAAVDDSSVDFFIHDSDHRYEHETAEFEMVMPFTRPGSVLVSDNAHAGNAFADFCGRHGLEYRYWREIPIGHFYPGAGIGMTIVTGAPSVQALSSTGLGAQ